MVKSLLKKLFIKKTFLTILFFSYNLHSQIIISKGDITTPGKFSLLEVASQNGISEGQGFRLPQLTQAQCDNLKDRILSSSPTEQLQVNGLTVFNTDKKEPYIWLSGINDWQILKVKKEKLPMPSTLVENIVGSGDATITPYNPSTDKTYNDVALEITNSTLCGTSRTPDILNNNTYQYKITLPGALITTDIKEVGKYQDYNEIIKNAVLGNESGYDVIKVTYESDAREKIAGATNLRPLFATLYVVYQESGIDKRVELQLLYGDCKKK